MKKPLDTATLWVYVVDMTNDTNTNTLPEAPYVVAFVRSDGRLRALSADPTDPAGIDKEFAIYPNRAAANAAIRDGRFQALGPQGSVLPVFSVPAVALFETRTVEVFALRPRTH